MCVVSRAVINKAALYPLDWSSCGPLFYVLLDKYLRVDCQGGLIIAPSCDECVRTPTVCAITLPAFILGAVLICVTLAGTQWHLVVFICISLMTDNAKHLSSHISFILKSPSKSLPNLNGIICLFY